MSDGENQKADISARAVAQAQLLRLLHVHAPTVPVYVYKQTYIHPYTHVHWVRKKTNRPGSLGHLSRTVALPTHPCAARRWARSR